MRQIILLAILLELTAYSYSQTITRDNAGLQGNQGASSGFFETSNPSNYPTGASSWWHLLDVRHSNPDNNFAMQIAGSFYDQELWFRKTNNSASQPWSRFIAETNGKVGIGTTNPQTKLDVNGIIQTYNKDNSTADWDNLRLWSDGANSYIESSGDENGLTIRSNSGGRISMFGNVGVGTSDTHGYKFGVAGNGRFESNVKILATDEAWAEGISVVKPSGWAGIRLTRNDPSTGNFHGNWALGYNASTGDDFSVSNSYGGQQYDHLLHISSATRNVGIGTSTPDSKLTVAGKIHSQEVKVTVNAGADFVFNEEYELRPLKEVESFIKENRHLPEIASAKDMETNGVELGKMNVALLQKVEELTLYLIEMKKENEAIRKEIEQLKKNQR